LYVQSTAANPSPDAADQEATRLRSLLVYFALTFAVGWSLWLVGAALLLRVDVSAGRSLFFLPGTFAPAIVALWMAQRSRVPGMAGELVERIFQWRVKARWYLFAVSYMIVAKLLAAGFYRIYAGTWPEFGFVPIYLMVLGTAFSVPVQAGEEIGWRGYALPRLADAVGLRAAGLILGMIWALWHLPLFLIPGTDSTGQPFVIFFLAVTAVSVAMTWLYLKTGGSLLLAMLMHAAINNTTGIVPASASPAPGAFSIEASALAWFVVVVLWAGAVHLLMRTPTRASPGSWRAIPCIR
jgi:membrane protease YdiL (CAAX protease family)